MWAHPSWLDQRVCRTAVTGCRVLSSSALVAVSVAVITVRVLIRDRRLTSSITRGRERRPSIPVPADPPAGGIALTGAAAFAAPYSRAVALLRPQGARPCAEGVWSDSVPA
jgi:hypothetical protein